MKLKVKSYNSDMNFHECIDLESDKKYRIDLLVSGKFPEGTTHESLIGNTYDAPWVEPFCYIAHDIFPEPIKES